MSTTKETVTKTVRNPLDNLKAKGRLATAPQPSPEAKKAGWARRDERMKIAEKIKKYKDLSYKKLMDVQKILRSAKLAGGDLSDKQVNEIRKILEIEGEFTLEDYQLLQYATNSKYMLDWIDRNLEKAPTKLEHTGEDGKDLTTPIIYYPKSE